ncbi:hypothetical protein KZX37_10360 [Microbacterium sp. EYE_5]|uniref:hypothetical protein n=1 Tax=unclassified Microbacterium TaxID=2609290 RepID=UPI0020037C94|nr:MULTISPECIES: hypothetical protein [unclassified Microbacterium]MCK6081082.1 hypothetical protein [Microbacterium sp. EYE_382]MCK6086352.1 hypothetical protein [Microbacterium sp. EYE_384]MCK6124150.1 hypothetical protein [Microbacterium sp. EYE_80]MCK6127059.1 hypothetical protein [Microbacterium sp. EYE_79]MCK6142037.1 hypothetical protein [Microbacterium sp. EYE_39]
MSTASSDPRTGQLSLTGQIPVTPTGQIPIAGQAAGGVRPVTGQISVVNDPARRPDVLLRRRMPPGHEISAWWMIGAFVAVSLGVVGLMTFFPA